MCIYSIQIAQKTILQILATVQYICKRICMFSVHYIVYLALTGSAQKLMWLFYSFCIMFVNQLVCAQSLHQFTTKLTLSWTHSVNGWSQNMILKDSSGKSSWSVEWSMWVPCKSTMQLECRRAFDWLLISGNTNHTEAILWAHFIVFKEGVNTTFKDKNA